MNTKHTPGPWHLGMRPGPIIYGPSGEQVTDMRIGVVSLDEHRANARLIAKAPELLDALARLTAWADVAGCDREPGSVLDSNIKAARAVIAQATGE